MVVQITPEIGRAMRKQVLRDQRTGTPLEQLVEARKEIERLQRLLDLSRKDVQDKESEIERLRERRASEEESGELPRRATSSSAMMVNGRPVITQADAARRINRAVATVSRYVNPPDGGQPWWEGVQQGNHWLIYADQDLSPKYRGKRQQ